VTAQRRTAGSAVQQAAHEASQMGLLGGRPRVVGGGRRAEQHSAGQPEQRRSSDPYPTVGEPQQKHPESRRAGEDAPRVSAELRCPEHHHAGRPGEQGERHGLTSSPARQPQEYEPARGEERGRQIAGADESAGDQR
jgi:hypothetical protein